MSRLLSRHRVLHWLWWSHHIAARAVRLLLLPFAALHRATMLARAAAFRFGWRSARRLPLPAVSVGNLAVGGAGKTPLAAWIAAFYVRRGLTPGVLLRGYGGDEPLVHQRLVPEAVVVPNPDRVAGAEAARAKGARILVLDDAFQRLDIVRELNIAVVNTENARAAPWPLPAGPWREGGGALARADLIVVTYRRTTPDEARRLANALAARWPRTPVAIAHLALARFEGMVSGRVVSARGLAGRRVVAAAGIADPASFAVQVRATGAAVQLEAYQDHHAFGSQDLAHLVRATREWDYVVVTEKDAVKLRPRWPSDVREPLVAVLEVQWEQNGDVVERALAAVSARAAVS
jgi:tetraacyldisaccharide 4'-kinase